MKRALSVLFIFALTLTATAGDRLPAGLLAHVSAKSLASAVANLDALATACVKDTPAAQQYKPGMLPMMMGAITPFPQNAWDTNAEIHAVAAVANGPQPVVILKISNMAAFKKGMTDGGIKLTGDDKKMSGPVPAFGGTWYFADAGGGRVACSPSEAARDFVVKALAAGWSPKHAAGPDLAINLDLKNTLDVFKPLLDGYMGQAKQALAAQGGRADPGKPLAAVVAKVATRALAALESDVPALNNLGITLSFSGERLKLAFSLSSDKGSGLDNLRAAYAGGEQPKYALANSFPKETVLLDTTADLSKFPDGWVKFYEDTLRDLGEAVMPSKAKELAALPRQFLALGIKDYAAGSYLAGDRLVMAFYFEHGAAKKIQDFLPGALKLGQEFVNNLIKMNDAGKAGKTGVFTMAYQPQAGKLGDVLYQRINVQFKPTGEGKVVSYDILFALGGKTVAGVYGQVNERDLHYAIDNYRKPSGAFVNSESARKAIADIDNRRIKFVEVRPVEALANLYVGQATLTGTDPKAARAAVVGLSASPACLVLASGAADRDMTLECVLPAEVVGDFIRNSGEFTRLSKEIGSGGTGKSFSPSDADAGDEEEDAEQPDDGGDDAEAHSPDSPLNLSKTTFGPDDDIEIMVTGVSEQMEQDKAFVAIYKAGAGHSEYGQYTYVPEGESLAVLAVPDAGDYEVRLYRKDGGYSDATLVAAVPFTSTDTGEPPVTLKLNKSEYRAGGSIAATVMGVSKRMQTNKAFVAIYKVGAPQKNYVQYAYLSQKNGTLSFKVPPENGKYEVRIHKSEKEYSDATVVASVPFTVTGNAK